MWVAVQLPKVGAVRACILRVRRQLIPFPISVFTILIQYETGNIAQEQSAMGLVLEAMRSAVGSLLEQSVEWGRIEAANQERKTAMRTNKVSRETLTPPSYFSPRK